MWTDKHDAYLIGGTFGLFAVFLTQFIAGVVG